MIFIGLEEGRIWHQGYLSLGFYIFRILLHTYLWRLVARVEKSWVPKSSVGYREWDVCDELLFAYHWLKGFEVPGRQSRPIFVTYVSTLLSISFDEPSFPPILSSITFNPILQMNQVSQLQCYDREGKNRNQDRFSTYESLGKARGILLTRNFQSEKNRIESIIFLLERSR